MLDAIPLCFGFIVALSSPNLRDVEINNISSDEEQRGVVAIKNRKKLSNTLSTEPAYDIYIWEPYGPESRRTRTGLGPTWDRRDNATRNRSKESSGHNKQRPSSLDESRDQSE